MTSAFLGARETARLIRAGKISCQEVVKAHLAQISKFQASTNALHVVNEKAALKLAEERDEALKHGKPLGRLHGVVFSAKDSVDIAGLPTTHGSAAGTIKSPERSSVFATRALDAGAVCIGKANMAEYGKSYYTDNPVTGRSNNPFSPEHSPGGSSGGDAAAVATGMASFALCSDSGGSVRVPANFCGLFGLYPTRGIFSDGASSSPPHAVSALFRNSGVLARTIDDIELLLSALSGHDPLDPYSTTFPTEALEARVGTGKFLFFSAMNGVSCDPEIGLALETVAKKFSLLGLQGENRCPPEFAASYEIFILLAAQISLLLEDLLAMESGKPRDLDGEGHIMKNLRQRVASELPPLTPETVVRCWAKVDQLRFSIAPLWQHYDFIIAPVTATLPPRHGTSLYKVGAQELQSQQVFQFASAVNTLGLPAIAFPTGLSKSGFPVGLQIIGPRFSERSLIRALKSAGIQNCLAIPGV